jgi:hypothetical protein
MWDRATDDIIPRPRPASPGYSQETLRVSRQRLDARMSLTAPRRRAVPATVLAGRQRLRSPRCRLPRSERPPRTATSPRAMAHGGRPRRDRAVTVPSARGDFSDPGVRRSHELTERTGASGRHTFARCARSDARASGVQGQTPRGRTPARGLAHERRDRGRNAGRAPRTRRGPAHTLRLLADVRCRPAPKAGMRLHDPTVAEPALTARMRANGR